MGRPGLVGLAARTAVVAGTATAVSGGMRNRQEQRMEAQQAQAQPAPPPPPAPVAAPAAAPDMTTELQKLADMKTQGLLTDDEFAKAKAQLLGI
jgi:nucleoid-associated protein YgaU